tara:strand:+ start:274 stop:477 length:204 start_codon:yes stop_codon:yes gene_type:complete
MSSTIQWNRVVINVVESTLCKEIAVFLREDMMPVGTSYSKIGTTPNGQALPKGFCCIPWGDKLAAMC